MKISKIEASYKKASRTVSENVRQLALAGIAVIWIFKVGDKDSGGVPFSPSLLWPLGFFVGGLAADLLQYLYFTAVWGIMNTVEWNRHQTDEDVPVSGKWNWIGIFFFWTKAILLVSGYTRLIFYIAKSIGI